MTEKANDIVLTGLSGRLPESDSIEEFADQLFEGIDLVTDDDRRWTPGLYGLPHRMGKLKNVQHFDASFFGVLPKQAQVMDPQLRLLLELTHETLVDAGINPVELRGSRTGVFVGVCNSETESICTSDPDKMNGYAITGCCRAMFSNRISYSFDFKGPSLSVDTACSSSMVALVEATKALRSGECDCAIVAGANLCLSPKYSLNFNRLNMLSPSGRCAAFDASGDGYVRSEAVVMVLLQRRCAARRVYATVRGARVNSDGYKEQGITYPSGAMQQQLAKETFEEARLDPKDISYIEAHGTGTKAGDPEEINAIAEVFCKDRNEPLLMGSVKSNMGHSEPASGLCSIIKVLISMERGMIPRNLHYNAPNPVIQSLTDGRIQVVDRNTKFGGGLVAINTFGFGGTNTHLILESETKVQDHRCSKYLLPRLVFASGRTEEAVNLMLDHAAAHDNPELHALIDAVHSRNIAGHSLRGYILFKEKYVVKEIFKEVTAEPRPTWFVFTGMGSQWPGMASDLMQLPAFASSICRCADTLSPLGIDLIDLITNAPRSAFEDVITSFVSIVSVQIALVNVLRHIGIRPDGMVGHSIGEIACAYADQTLTVEQAVLCAYWRGRSIIDSNLPPGAMAAVGLTWEQCLEKCPQDIIPACHNSNDNVTVSGPVASIENFVNKLTSEGVFARRVNSSGVAFHSKYIASAAPLLRKSLEQVIKNSKPRSQRWVSTSMTQEQLDNDSGKYSDATYHTNNLLSPVYFASAIQNIPEGAIVLEVSPHSLLQPILKRALPSCAHVPLMRKDCDNLLQFLSAVGKMYGYGAQPAANLLYPPIQWPVSRGTPGLSSYVRWDHSTEWHVARETENNSTEHIIEIDLNNKEDTFIADYNIDGRILFPASGHLILVWRTLAKIHNRKLADTPVQFENVRIKRNTILTKNSTTRFLINILNGTGEFDIFDGNNLIVTGSVKILDNPSIEKIEISSTENTTASLTFEDIYKELRLRGYNLNGDFKGIISSDKTATNGELIWKNNWMSFIDTMFQFYFTGMNTQELYLPVWMQCLKINPKLHNDMTKIDASIPVAICNGLNTITAGGIEINNFKPGLVTRRIHSQAPPILEKYIFMPYKNEEGNLTVDEALTISLQVILENVGTFKLKCTELPFNNSLEEVLGPKVMQILKKEPQVRIDYYIAGGSSKWNYISLQGVGITVNSKEIPENDCNIIVSSNAVSSDRLINLAAYLNNGSMLLLQERRGTTIDKTNIDGTGLVIVSQQKSADFNIVLLRKRPIVPLKYQVIEITDDFTWIENIQNAVKDAENEETRIYAVSYTPSNGILGLATCIRSEGCKALRVFFLPNAKEKFSVDSIAYSAQVELDLAVNVLKSSTWGSYRNIQLEPNSTVAVKDAYVNSLTHGDMASLRWIESPLYYIPDRKLCQVHYASLNFRDVMMASGKMPREALPGNFSSQECVLGLEFSGKSAKGKRVMGIVPSRGLATTVIPDKDFLWEVPQSWSLDEAATVPLAYTTAYYALVVRGRMRQGESLLIHSGAGGVGLASITIALHAGCKVFTTVGNSEKRKFLRDRFPNLPEDNIGCSRDISFEKMIMKRTKGRGVDIVLNSLAAEKLQASVRCLAFGGRILELAKLDLFLNNPLGLSIFLKNTTFHGVLLEALFDSEDEKAKVVKCVMEGIANGAVKPLPATIYSHQHLEQAFRFMVTGKHIGKIMIRIRKKSSSSRDFRMSSVPKLYMDPNKVYIIVGGLGGFGLELTQWLVDRGATKLVLNSRGGIRTSYQSWRTRRWHDRGVQVLISTTDSKTVKGAKDLINEACSIGALGGVFNLAAVIRDAMLENLSQDDFRIAALPKIEVTKSLDQATREMVQDLDYFVTFSSVTSGRGNPGQCNYGYANSSMERLMELRREDGLHGLAIQWGAIGDVGLTIENLGEDAVISGTVPQKILSCLDAFEKILRTPYAVTASMTLADKQRVVAHPSENLVQAIANILGIINHTNVSQTTTLANLGIDSLMVAEIKQTLERCYDIIIGVQEIRNLTFHKIRELA